MEGYSSFRPKGDTFLVLGSTPASGYATRAGGPSAGEVVYLVWNLSATAAYLGYGMTSAAAVNNAVIPVIGTPRAVLAIPGASVQTFTLSPLLFFAAAVPSGNAELMITPGEGV